MQPQHVDQVTQNVNGQRNEKDRETQPRGGTPGHQPYGDGGRTQTQEDLPGSVVAIFAPCSQLHHLSQHRHLHRPRLMPLS